MSAKRPQHCLGQLHRIKRRPKVAGFLFGPPGRRLRRQVQRPEEFHHAKSQRQKLWAWDAAESDTEIRLPIGVAALTILKIEAAADRGEHRQATGTIAEAALPSPHTWFAWHARQAWGHRPGVGPYFHWGAGSTDPTKKDTPRAVSLKQRFRGNGTDRNIGL